MPSVISFHEHDYGTFVRDTEVFDEGKIRGEF